MNNKQLSLFSLIITIGFSIWTFCLPLWDSTKWFLDKRFENMWFTFDIIFIIFLILLTYLIWKENNISQFLAPLMFGMILTDWIFNISLWVVAGYNLLEFRFILAFIFIIITTISFFWFFLKVYQTTK